MKTYVHDKTAVKRLEMSGRRVLLGLRQNRMKRPGVILLSPIEPTSTRSGISLSPMARDEVRLYTS